MSQRNPLPVGLAAVLAGPFVLALLAVIQYAKSIPATIDPDGSAVFLPVLVCIASIVGFLPALIAATIAGSVLRKVAERFELARSPIVWLLVGAAVPGLIIVAAGGWGEWLAAFCGAGALCALVVWRKLAAAEAWH